MTFGFFCQVVELDLSTVVPSLSGPKRPHDRVSVSEMKKDFESCLVNSVGSFICDVRRLIESLWAAIRVIVITE